jgi:hypothetical protein
LGDYLFYIVNAFCKKSAKPIIKQKIEYLCPACSFLGKEQSILHFDFILKCDECQAELQTAVAPQKKNLLSVFAQHNKSGYRCPDCERFIPHPLDNSSQVSCPYFDCFFVGFHADLHKMHHPNFKSNPEKIILDASIDDRFASTMKDNLASSEAIADRQLEIAEDLRNTLAILQDIIETQSNSVPYCSSNATARHKQYVYQAFANLLKKFPLEMSEYLTDSNNGYAGFQHRIFQEYIKLLEEALPFFISKNKKPYRVDSLLDDNLSLFDGISVFNSIITNKLSIKNETKEFYVGGRKAAYAKPFYIGKLLNVSHGETKHSLMHLVENYSFSKIRMRDIDPLTPVIVTHLRVPPHYQMGGMVYVNRIRKKIVERAKAVIPCQA